MATQPTILSATGTYTLENAGNRIGTGSLVIVDGTSWSGSLVLKVNTAYPGEAQALSNIAYRNRTTGAAVTAGTAITTFGVYEVDGNNQDLVGSYTHTSGSASVTVLPMTQAASIPTTAVGMEVPNLVMLNPTARIVGGSTNGLAIRNSGNTRDNLSLPDNGASFNINNGTISGGLGLQTANGDVPASVIVNPGASGVSGGIAVHGNTGDKAFAAYWDGTVLRTAWEVAQPSSGFGVLNQMKSGGYVTRGLAGTVQDVLGATATGAVSSVATITKAISGIADNTFTDVFTVTVPNAAHAGTIKVTFQGVKGAGDAEGAAGSVSTTDYNISIQRTAGATTTAATSAALGTIATTIAAGNAVLTTAQCSGMTGGVGATQTFTIQVKIARAAGASTNHTCFAKAELLNSFATGITIA